MHTPVAKATLGTPNSVTKQEDVPNNDSVAMVKSEPQLLADNKYGMKANIHEDITDDENDANKGHNKNSYHDNSLGVKNEPDGMGGFKKSNTTAMTATVSNHEKETANGYKDAIKSEFMNEVKEEVSESNGNKRNNKVDDLVEDKAATTEKKGDVKMEGAEESGKVAVVDADKKQLVEVKNEVAKLEVSETKAVVPGKKGASSLRLYLVNFFPSIIP